MADHGWEMHSILEEKALRFPRATTTNSSIRIWLQDSLIFRCKKHLVYWILSVSAVIIVAIVVAVKWSDIRGKPPPPLSDFTTTQQYDGGHFSYLFSTARPTPRIGVLTRITLGKNILEIFSSQDFKRIQPTHDTLHVHEIQEAYSTSMSFAIPEEGNIKNITIQFPVSSSWMKFLSMKFPNGDHLTINVDEYCAGANERKTNAQSLAFKKVETLKLNNFFQCRDVLDYLQNWKFPNIRHLEVSSSDLTYLNLQSVLGFVKKFENLIEDVTYDTCFICLGCDLTTFNSERLKLKPSRVVNRRDKPFRTS